MGRNSYKKLLILGAGGHGKAVADCALEKGIYREIAFLDDAKNGDEVLGITVIGVIADIMNMTGEFSDAFVAIGNNKLRVHIIEELIRLGYHVPVIIHPKAIVSKFSSIGKGSTLLAGSVVNTNVSIDTGCIINTCASIDHDCILGKGIHVSPGARLGGSVTVDDYSWICIGANIANNIKIGSNSIVAAGAVVVKDVEHHVMVAGVPANIKKRLVNHE